MKKILCLILCLMMILPAVPSLAYTIDSGTCGTGLTWTLSDDGTLTISGSGAMRDYSSDDGETSTAPWFTHAVDINNIVIENGMTHIGDSAFSY